LIHLRFLCRGAETAEIFSAGALPANLFRWCFASEFFEGRGSVSHDGQQFDTSIANAAKLRLRSVRQPA